MKKIFIFSIIAIIVIAVAGFSILMAKKVAKFNDYMDNITINEVDLSTVEDGIYYSEIDSGMIFVSVEVEINDHKLSEIKLLKHQNGQGDGADVITDKIIDEQRINVDAVSGATLSSQIIQKAVETAIISE